MGGKERRQDLSYKYQALALTWRPLAYLGIQSRSVKSRRHGRREGADTEARFPTTGTPGGPRTPPPANEKGLASEAQAAKHLPRPLPMLLPSERRRNKDRTARCSAELKCWSIFPFASPE